MRKKRFTDEQMVAILRGADPEPIGLSHRQGVSEQTIYTWRRAFGTFQADVVRRLNARLSARPKCATK